MLTSELIGLLNFPKRNPLYVLRVLGGEDCYLFYIEYLNANTDKSKKSGCTLECLNEIGMNMSGKFDLRLVKCFSNGKKSQLRSKLGKIMSNIRAPTLQHA